jgi:hypothetical protein
MVALPRPEAAAKDSHYAATVSLACKALPNGKHNAGHIGHHAIPPLYQLAVLEMGFARPRSFELILFPNIASSSQLQRWIDLASFNARWQTRAKKVGS